MRIEGVFGGDANLEGGCAWVAVDGKRYEVAYPDGWRVEFEPLRLFGPTGLVATVADWLGVEGDEGPGTYCQIGPGFVATTVERLPTGPSMSEDALIKFHRSGGFMGASDWLIVDESGRATTSSRIAGRSDFLVEANELSGLKASVDRLDWPSLSVREPGPGIPDGYGYALYHGEFQVSAVDPPGNDPPLWELIRELGRLLAYRDKDKVDPNG